MVGVSKSNVGQLRYENCCGVCGSQHGPSFVPCHECLCAKGGACAGQSSRMPQSALPGSPTMEQWLSS